MLLRVIAVGTRMPAWVEAAVQDYGRRMPAELRLEWRVVKAEPRTGSAGPVPCMAREAQRIREVLPAGSRIVLLDERGEDLDSAGLAARLASWQRDAHAVALLIGGPDGVDAALKRDAHERIRLSSLTLPHALVRVVLAEQLYRAWSIGAQHPYHRE